MSARVQFAWKQEWNRQTQSNEVGRCSELQFFFCLYFGLHLCGHFTYKTPKRIKDRDNEVQTSGLQCRRCMHAAGELMLKAVSAHEAKAWGVVDRCFAGHMLVEISVLGGNWPIADIWLPWSQDGCQRLDLIIMIDGEKHFSKAWMDTDVRKQQQIDIAFNAECWRQEHKLLRLYSDDDDEWEQLITQALARAHAQPMQKFQQFSKQFNARVNAKDRTAPMIGTGQRNTGAYFEPE